MRIEFKRRENGTPTQQLVDGFVFLSGGIFDLLRRVDYAAEQWGFGGKIRIEVVTRDLLEKALAPLAEQYPDDELERGTQILLEAIERVGRQFFPEHYDEADAA